jgi:DMSO/TMAO reductase YedYZ molybdopterin-dependent catalytic subunit
MTLTRSRRTFLKSGICLSGELLLGCEDEPLPPGWAPGSDLCSDELSRAAFLGTQAFLGEGDTPLHMPLGVGLDGRLFTDLSLLSPDALITPNEHFYVRTRHPDQLDAAAPFRIRLGGLVDAPLALELDWFLARERFLGPHLLECSGNSLGGHFGLLSAADWHGVPVSELLGSAAVRPEATRVLISGFDQHSQPSANNHSTPGASWIFSFEQLEQTGAFLATKMNGRVLPPDHGAPIRLVVPGWYGCTCIKWVDRIELVDDSAAATSQMTEFAGRTHQPEAFELARDYLPAEIEAAAMPVRVERWQLPDGIAHRVVGIRWGGDRPVEQLSIQFGDGGWKPVALCPERPSPRTWSLWAHLWQPAAPGEYAIRLRVTAPALRQRRLDLGYYTRTVSIRA